MAIDRLAHPTAQQFWKMYIINAMVIIQDALLSNEIRLENMETEDFGEFLEFHSEKLSS